MKKTVKIPMSPRVITPVFSCYDSAVEYEYDYTQCTENCDSICRCKKIVNERVTKVDLSQSFVYFTCKYHDAAGKVREKDYKPTLIEQYCIDRLARIYKLYKPESWDVLTCGGYYGEEIDRVELNNPGPFIDALRNMFACTTDLEQVQFVLKAEYAHLLDVVEFSTNCRIAEIDIETLTRQDDYFARVKRHEIDDYKINTAVPVCVTRHGTRLIDGYHRVAKLATGVHPVIILE